MSISFPNSHNGILTPKMRVLGDVVSGKRLGDGGGPLMNGNKRDPFYQIPDPPIKDLTELPCPLCHMRVQ